MLRSLSHEEILTFICAIIGLAVIAFNFNCHRKSKPKQQKKLGFIELYTVQNPIVDIIAIHGLDGHRERSWAAEDGTLWLRDLLPKDIPNARILSYGYDADTRSFAQTSTQTIFRHADAFAEDLSQLRRTHPKRPIIFLAHSLGGIILKKALILCHNGEFEAERTLRDISTSTLAVLFFGTPYSGANGVQLAEWMGRLLSMIMYTNNRVLKDLDRDSPELENIQRLYLPVSKRLDTIFFYEEYRTPIVGGKSELIVPRQLAIVQGDGKARVVLLHADHCEMVKYTSKKDENYRKVVDYIAEFVEKATATVEKNWILEDNHRSVAKGILPDKASLKGPTTILKPRPRGVKDFVGRKDILDAMCETHFGRKSSPSSDDGPIITVLTGMGGSGKTQIAVKFASFFEERFHNVPVFFLDASSEASLNADLRTLVRSQTDKYEDALTWLASGIEDWLLIMDNADDPSLKFSDFIPRCRHGHIIITTRNATHILLAPRSTHTVNVLPVEDSVTLLLTSSCYGDNEVNRSLAKDIAEQLGRLPLALAHAAAYILINSSLDTFLSTYGKSRDQFLRSVPNHPQSYPHSVERTIEMSLRCLSPNAQDMIRLLAYMDARSIARCIIEMAAERKFLHIPQEVEPLHPDTTVQAEILQSIFCPSGEWKSFEFDGMIGECLRYSLLRLTIADGEKFYSMHPLVQKYLQTMSEFVRDYPAGRLLVRLLASATTCSGRWYEFFQMNRLLGPHVQLVCLQVITEAGDHYGFGRILCELGNELSIGHLERCVKIRKASHDYDDERVLIAMIGLASGYHLLGRTQEALPLQEEVLESRKRLLGPDHLSTLSAMARLAGSYRSVGRVQEALPLEEEVLKSQKRLLGPDHLDTLSTMANLASSYRSVGREQEALPLKEEVLKSRKRLLGPEHLDTLSAMANLASGYSSVRREQEALPLQEGVLKSRKQLLGPDHLETLSAMANLALSYWSVGRVQEALPLEEEVLKSRKRLLGPDHLDTLSAMANLAASYWSVGRVQEALPLQEEVLESQKQFLGPNHLDTLSAMANLAASYRSVERAQEALPLEEEVLESRKRLLGLEHLETLSAMANLALSYWSVGRVQEVLPLQEEVLKNRKRLLGSDHRHTLLAMYNLLFTLKALAMEKELRTLVEVALPLHEKVHGFEHKYTVWIRGLLK